MWRRSAALRAFTFLELLVVLAIISLCIAVLLPSLSKARAQTSRTRCLNQIRQIGVGLAVYLADYDDYPPALASSATAVPKGMLPVWYAENRGGLLALRPTLGFSRRALTCPEGWASGGDGSWYESRGISPAGAAYMDYAYWPDRYPPGDGYDVVTASFKYRAKEKGTKIIVSDVIVDLSGPPGAVSTLGFGNHGSNHIARPVVVQRTDGRGRTLKTSNTIQSLGGSVLFSDYHAQWFDVRKFTQQVDGLCFPPPDQW